MGQLLETNLPLPAAMLRLPILLFQRIARRAVQCAPASIRSWDPSCRRQRTFSFDSVEDSDLLHCLTSIRVRHVSRVPRVLSDCGML